MDQIKSWAKEVLRIAILSAVAFILIFISQVFHFDTNINPNLNRNSNLDMSSGRTATTAIAPDTDTTSSATLTNDGSLHSSTDTAGHAYTYPYAEVVRIVDGDTVIVRFIPNNSTESKTITTLSKSAESKTATAQTTAVNAIEEKARLIGINTPESVDPRKPVQCFGREASEYTKKYLLGKKVRLASDPTQTVRDKYDRLLVYIFIEEKSVPTEILFNQKIVQDGYAYEHTYAGVYQYQKELRTAANSAKKAGLGLWAKDTCAGSL